jgi:glycosyltransferase involved in cell wall biosynthesis
VRTRRRLLMATTTPATLRGFLLPYAAHFRALGWRVDAVTGQGEPDSELSTAFDRVWRVGWTRRLSHPRNAAAIRQGRKVLVEGCYDIIHTHTPIASFVVRLAAGTMRSDVRPRIVYTAHGFHFHPQASWVTNLAFSSAERLAGRWTDRLVVINRHDLAQARRLRIVPASSLVHHPGIGIDLEWYRRTPELEQATREWRGRLGLVERDTVFSVIAALDPGKNHAAAVRALALTRNPRYHLAFAGTGRHQPYLEAECERLGVSDRVHFLGMVDDVRPLVLLSAAMLLLSFREGLSRAVLEALALGTPVIGSDVRGIAELVADDGGVLLDPRDDKGIALALDRYAGGGINDRRIDVRKRLEPYSIERLMELHLELYKSVIADASKVAARS